ncbi:hypothetical protein BBF96_08745 [Anoxybacter fermentans]|uniref:Uncharacterized protein n=1 Tax=Anoxybacter fermentans TaxID=1323375 RepID=A0A3S9SZ57_9FIRM|nr:hypothetical protein [Anoxybacter fermentans]AZR73462.1 hypothetical protein BBF96_08745 [Anoxybacter fermentans]
MAPCLTEDLRTKVEKKILASESLEIKGEFIFDTKGLSKKEILELKLFITDIKVISEKMINIEK